MKSIEDILKKLPPELREEVADFAESLLKKKTGKKGGTLRQDWAGSLKKYREQYTSLDLQKKALQWRGD